MDDEGLIIQPKRTFFVPEIVAPEERLSVSGMTPKQAVEGASRWWNTDAREYQRRARNRSRDGIRNDEELQHESGIFFGKKWNELDRREQLAVVNAWHKEYCRVNFGVIPI